MKKVYQNSEAIAYWIIAGYFAVVSAIAVVAAGL